MDLKWLEIAVDTTTDQMDALAARLTMNGVTGLVLEDEEDFKAFLEQNRQYWDYVDEELLETMKGVCRIKFYVTDDADGKAQLERWMEGIDAPYTSAPLGENDWATSWQKYYKPLAVGKKLYIIPEWEREGASAQGKVPVYLNPGLTFGTGSHATTRLVLTALEGAIHGGERVADLGCGSGILSIAALKLGAKHAVAVDIDEKCPEVAYANAAMNGIGKDDYEVLVGDVAADTALREKLGRCDVVLANIVSDVIIALAPHVGGMLTEKGLFICSGIIDDRAEEVAEKLREAGLVILQTKSADGWFAYVCQC